MTRKKGENRVKPTDAKAIALTRSISEQSSFNNSVNNSIRVSVMDGWQMLGHSVFSLNPSIFARTIERHSVVSRKFIIEVDEALPCELVAKELKTCVRRIKEKIAKTKRRAD